MVLQMSEILQYAYNAMNVDINLHGINGENVLSP